MNFILNTSFALYSVAWEPIFKQQIYHLLKLHFHNWSLLIWLKVIDRFLSVCVVVGRLVTKFQGIFDSFDRLLTKQD